MNSNHGNTGLWKVIDASYLRLPHLEEFLSADPDNRVVFDDHACMEAYKGPGLRNILNSLEIVGRYPSQVVVLMETNGVISLQARFSYDVSPRSFVDVRQTRDFNRFCRGVREAVAGGAPDLQQQLMEKGSEAKAILTTWFGEAAAADNGLRGAAELLGPELLKELRTGTNLSRESRIRVAIGIRELALNLFDRVPDVATPTTREDFVKSLVFRVAAAVYFLVMRWGADGGVETAAAGTLLNDRIDSIHVAYATYFDGILSADEKLNDLYRQTSWFLQGISQDLDRADGETAVSEA